MSLYPYTQWSSSNSSATDDRARTDGGGWWKNTKDAIKKPWRRKRGESKKQPPSRTPATEPDQWKRERPFGAFPPIMAQLTPGVYQQERRNSNPEERRRPEDFDLPEYSGQRRPRLDSVFPMRHAPFTGSGGGEKAAGPRPGAGGIAVGRSSSFNEADSRVRGRGRGEGEGDQGTTGHIKGDSVDSSGSGERTIDRRRRRQGVVRQLPRLPPRTSYGHDWNDVHSLPEVGHRRRRLVPAPLERGGFGGFMQHHYGTPTNPARGTAVQDFTYPLWGSPADSLPTLAEESDSGDIKGFDDFKLY